MIGSGFLGVAAALGITLGLLLLAVHLLKRVQGMSRDGGSPVPLKLLKIVPVSPKHGIGLLQVADRILVVSVGDAGVRLLTELEGASRQEAMQALPAAAGRARPAWRRWLPLLALVLLPAAAQSQTQTPEPAPAAAPTAEESLLNALPTSLGAPLQLTMGDAKDPVRISGAVGVVVFIGFLTLLPAILLLMTSFTRILIVLQFLRPALGTQNAPPMQLLVALAVLLTGVVMHPVLLDVQRVALTPFLEGRITQAEAYQVGIRPFREFMIQNTSEKDLGMFTELTGIADEAESLDEIPILTLTSAFVTSELRTAFQMGFLIFIPFIVVDLIVASVLMSLGMFMLPPMMVSLPFKLLLFVLADGWGLVVKNLVLSFR